MHLFLNPEPILGDDTSPSCPPPPPYSSAPIIPYPVISSLNGFLIVKLAWKSGGGREEGERGAQLFFLDVGHGRCSG